MDRMKINNEAVSCWWFHHCSDVLLIILKISATITPSMLGYQKHIGAMAAC